MFKFSSTNLNLNLEQNVVRLKSEVKPGANCFLGRNLPGARCPRFQDTIYLEQDVRGLRGKYEL